MKAFVLSDPEFRYIENVFLYDPWDGLGTIRWGAEGPRFEPVKKRVPTQSALSSRARPDISTDIQALKSALKEVDGYLKAVTFSFILQNLSEVREYDTGFKGFEIVGNRSIYHCERFVRDDPRRMYRV